MAFRLTRHLYHRICPSGDVKTLFVLPVFHSETIGKINGQIRMCSTPDVGNTTTGIGPFGAIEYAFALFYLPWSLAATYLPDTGMDPMHPRRVSEWDSLMRRLVLTYSSSASSHFYDPDSPAATDKLSMDPAGKDSAAAKAGDPVVHPDYPSLGPQGLLRIHNSERMLSSMTKIDAGIASASTTVYTADQTFNDMVYSDNIDLDLDIGLGGSGYVVAVVTRHDVSDPSLGYACSYGTESGSDTGYSVGAADRIAALNALHHGDSIRIKEILKDPTTAISQYLRTLLFFGDVSLQPLNSTMNPSLAALYADNNVFRKNDISVQCKMMVEYSTPYTIVPDLMT